MNLSLTKFSKERHIGQPLVGRGSEFEGTGLLGRIFIRIQSPFVKGKSA